MSRGGKNPQRSILLTTNECSNFCGSGFGLWIQSLGWEFSVAAGAGDIFEGLAGDIGSEIRSADGMPIFERAEGFSGRAECHQFWVFV